MTIRSWLRSAEERLRLQGVEEAKLDATLLLAEACGKDRSWILAHLDDDANGFELAEELLARRLDREPLAYILGRREFFGRIFKVAPGVLIPRQETEVLVEAAMAAAPAHGRVVDIGTGSGCIAITLSLERPDLQVAALERSSDALAIARENARTLGAKVEFIQGDARDLLLTLDSDLIVTNPPYVADGARLMPEVGRHEPPGALFAGIDGLDFYRMLAQTAPKGTHLLTEIGDEQAGAVSSVFRGFAWQDRGIWRDLGGRIRVLAFSLP